MKITFHINLCFLVILVALSSCENAQEVKLGAFQNLNDTVKYVGAETCKTCHQDKFNTFTHTEMGRSMQRGVLNNSSAEFHNQRPIYDSSLNLFYLPFAVDSNMFIQEYRLSKQGDTIHNRIEKIDLIVGSGQHTNSHLMNKNGYIHQMPLTFYTQKGEWHLPPGFEKGNNSRFSRYIGEECMTCHNGYANYDTGSRNRFYDIPEGIDCERCHGPGGIHVTNKKNGLIVNTETDVDYSIINPSKLSSELQMDVCQRCHLQGISSLNKNTSYSDFKPGEHLKNTYELYKAKFNDSQTSFIMAAHPDRLRMSPCFIQSRANTEQPDMTCITCHNPHVSVKDVSEKYFNNKCMGCHSEQKCSENKVLIDSKNNNCIECHMPKASAYDIPHVSITEHFIQKKPAPRKVSKADIAESEWEKQKDFLKLVCLTNENPEPYNTALAYLNYYEKYVQNPLLLDSAKAYLSKCNDLDLWIRYHYLQKDYASIIKIASDSLSDAWTNYRISEAYYNKQRVQIAIKYLRKSVSKDKHNIDFRNRLTTLLIEDNKVDEAYKVALLTMSLNSSNAEANNLLGFCLVIKGELNGSEQYFLQANYLNPDDIKPIENLASLYLNTGDKIKSKKYIDKLIKLNPNSLNYKKLNNVWKLL